MKTTEQQHIALVNGEPVLELPTDLYIPPDALEVFLESFEGPLDLLLYLIRKQNLDILNIPIAQVTEQYMTYVELMCQVHLELAAEYLVMAAMLAEIKSRMLLPRPTEGEEEGEDPRAALMRRLQEYERYRKAGEDINELPRVGRDIHLAWVNSKQKPTPTQLPHVSLDDLLTAFSKVMARAALNKRFQVGHERLSMRERMTEILGRVESESFLAFEDLFKVDEGRAGLVVTFIAVLELLKESLIVLVQQKPFDPIHVKAAGNE